VGVDATDSESKTRKAGKTLSSFPESGKKIRLGSNVGSDVFVNNTKGLSIDEVLGKDDNSEKRRSVMRDALKNSRPSSNKGSNAVTHDK
jgi:hypothetical protein